MLASACIKHGARASSAPLDSALLKMLIPALLGSCKEKNTAVKAAAESALMYVLRLRDGESTLQVKVSSFFFFRFLFENMLEEPTITIENTCSYS